jgi:Ni,Fe-hydrogenase III large subunit
MTGPASAAIRAGQAVPCRPWPRYLLTGAAWDAMRAALAEEPGLVFQGLWADTAQVHALFLAPDPVVASVPVERGLYGALSPWRPGAALFERAVADLWGHRAADALDPRPWLDHGRWPVLRPLSARPMPNAAQPEPWEALPAEGSGSHAIPLGPIHGIVEAPSALRITAEGEGVVRLEARLGYAHRGALLLMRGKPVRAAAKIAARLSGADTVAHAWAFARAAEAALGAEAPPRAAVIRAVAAELERISGHLGALSAVCRLAGFPALTRQLASLREAVLRAVGVAFGHRLAMDLVVPGGVAGDLAPEGGAALLGAAETVAAALPGLERSFAQEGGLALRLGGLGRASREVAARFAPGGVVGRASGRTHDARRGLPYPPYGALAVEVPVEAEGDAAARARLRLAEIRESVRLARVLLGALPSGPLLATLPSGGGEGLGWTEGAHGEVWHWVRLDGGTVAAAFARDPGWLHWPVLEAAAAGAGVGEVPLIAASTGAGVAGVDL